MIKFKASNICCEGKETKNNRKKMKVTLRLECYKIREKRGYFEKQTY